MLKWALIFFIISIVAGVFGFTGIAAGAASIAKVLFWIAVILFVLFGAFMERSGTGQLFMDFALSLTGSQAGGPGKVSVVRK